ncbi:hypothetical protein [Allokutzneria oryzae]|uniref:Uncharacterized protein n=1 Tax=Allokutzneria oryzae TaxID=1378989 RepID=A0ABV6ACH1_9PSEU
MDRIAIPTAQELDTELAQRHEVREYSAVSWLARSESSSSEYLGW